MCNLYIVSVCFANKLICFQLGLYFMARAAQPSVTDIGGLIGQRRVTMCHVRE